VSGEVADQLEQRGYETIEKDGIKVLVSPNIRLTDNAELSMRSFLGIKFFETRGVVPMKLSCGIAY